MTEMLFAERLDTCVNDYNITLLRWNLTRLYIAINPHLPAQTNDEGAKEKKRAI